MTTNESQYRQSSWLPKFGERFLQDHAGAIITDPKTAIVEILANCSDAGADRVEINWLQNDADHVEIADNGTGMSHDEFTRRWMELSYNRQEAQGSSVQFPSANRASNRKVFGKNGKGRHGMFCFADEYTVETRKEGELSVFLVRRTFGRGERPFEVIIQNREKVSPDEHGTKIWAESLRRDLDEQSLKDLLGSKFIADPSFRIFVNNQEVELTDLSHLIDECQLRVDDMGTVSVLLIDTEKISKSSKQHGVAWWVNKRLVGEASWRMQDGSQYLDRRMSKAKRYTFVVMADILSEDVLDDWSGFRKGSPVVTNVVTVVEDYIQKKLTELFEGTYNERKREAIASNRGDLAVLSPVSRQHIGQFLDDIQKNSPTIRQEHLSDAVKVLANLEKSRSGYALLQELARLKPDDLDGLRELLKQWTVREMRTVLDELYTRLKLIERLENVIADLSSSELHDIQPLFQRGLWILGPEYESVEFTSNRSLATVVETLLKGKGESGRLSTPRRRPDFVILPDSSLSIYSCDQFDEHSEVNGIGKVLIVELKRAGLSLTRNEIRQAEDYALEIRKSGKVEATTPIVAYVLGDMREQDAREPVKIGEHTIIYPVVYDTVLKQAHARTYNLMEKLRKAGEVDFVDQDVEEILRTTGVQEPLGFSSNKHLIT